MGVLIVTCGAGAVVGRGYLHSSVVNDRQLHPERLVANGPYRWVRNPLYLGNILLAFGWGRWPAGRLLGLVSQPSRSSTV